MKQIKLLIVISIILTGWYSYGQCDKMVHSIKSDNNLVLITLRNNNLVATKLNTSGATVWIKEYVFPGGSSSPFKIYDAVGDYYYIIHFLDYFSSDGTQLLKISKADGNLIWQSPMFASIGIETHQFKFIDYDQNTAIFSTTNGVYSINKLAVSYTATLLNTPGQFLYHIEKDSKGNLICGSTMDNYPSIRKINGTDFNTTIWEKQYGIGLPSTALLPTIQKIFLDSADNIYALSNEDNADLYKINSNNGNVLWRLNNITSENEVSDYKFKDDYLYISFRHIYVGSIYSEFEILKINVPTGTLYWNTGLSNQLHMTSVGIPVSGSNSNNEAMLSFDFDCSGNIYATGYYADPNYGPAAWGIMKIDGINGTKINDKTITTNYDQYIDQESTGLSAYVINDEPIFLGNLEYAQYSSVRTFVKTDLSLNNVLSIQAPCAVLEVNQIAPINTIKIHPNPTKGKVYFELDSTTTLKMVTLYSIDGKELKQWQNPESIDMGNYPYGVYMVKMQTNNEEVIVKKIIKN